MCDTRLRGVCLSLTEIFARVIDQVLGPLISKSDSNGGDDGALVSATTGSTSGMNVGGLAVTPVLALGPNGTQQHILQVIDVNQSHRTSTMWLTGDGRKVTAHPVTSQLRLQESTSHQLLGEVDSNCSQILANAMEQVTSGDVVDLQETSPSSNSD